MGLDEVKDSKIGSSGCFKWGCIIVLVIVAFKIAGFLFYMYISVQNSADVAP